MYLYNKKMYDNFRFKFDGLENIEQSYAQCLQDMFVLSVLNGKKEGTFLEIGAFHATFISNTFLLERYFGWNGVSIDIVPNAQQSFIGAKRSAKFILGDATKLDYKKILKENFEKRIDYLSLDIEPNIHTLACLKLLPLDEYRFSIITYETDHYDPNTPKEINDYIRSESRKILKNLGYILIAGNLSNRDDHEFEDWHVDSLYFSKETINKFKRTEDTTLPAHKYIMEGLD